MSLDDERVRFYLRHREQIEEWAALRREAAVALDDWLEGLTVRLQILAGQLGDDVQTEPQFGSDWPKLLLRRCTWPDESGDAIGVGLEWNRSKTTLVGSSAPVIGVHSARTTLLGSALRSDPSVRALTRERRETVNPYWLAYRSILPAQAFPELAEAYRDQLSDAIRQAWMAYAPHIDGVLDGLRNKDLLAPG